jgi:hypothetical protein
MTVSLKPLSHGSGGLVLELLIGCRLTIWNCTSWMRMGCASSVKLNISHTSADRGAASRGTTGMRAGTQIYLINEGPDEPFGGARVQHEFEAADPATTR